MPSLLYRSVAPADADDFLKLALEFDSLQALWNDCPRSDWMVWLLDRANCWKLIRVDFDAILSASDVDLEAAAAYAESFDDIVALLASEADSLRTNHPRLFEKINLAPLLERRASGGYAVADAAEDAPLTSRLCAMFKP